MHPNHVDLHAGANIRPGHCPGQLRSWARRNSVTHIRPFHGSVHDGVRAGATWKTSPRAMEGSNGRHLYRCYGGTFLPKEHVQSHSIG
jgi:hypothetical protein